MPILDGLESTRLIRQMGYSAPIIALSAFAEESNIKDCMDSGMDMFIRFVNQNAIHGSAADKNQQTNSTTCFEAGSKQIFYNHGGERNGLITTIVHHIGGRKNM
jgi:CheY-like chemotaxis protein